MDGYTLYVFAFWNPAKHFIDYVKKGEDDPKSIVMALFSTGEVFNGKLCAITRG